VQKFEGFTFQVTRRRTQRRGTTFDQSTSHVFVSIQSLWKTCAKLISRRRSVVREVSRQATPPSSPRNHWTVSQSSLVGCSAVQCQWEPWESSSKAVTTVGNRVFCDYLCRPHGLAFRCDILRAM